MRGRTEGLRALAELKTLTRLDLSMCSLFTDEGLRAMSELKSITELNLSYCWEVTDAGLRQLSGLSQPTTLVLGRGCGRGRTPLRLRGISCAVSSPGCISITNGFEEEDDDTLTSELGSPFFGYVPYGDDWVYVIRHCCPSSSPPSHPCPPSG